MLGSCGLQSCGSHRAAGPITAIECAGGLVAVGQQEGSTLLFCDGNFSAVVELPMGGRGEGASALAFSVGGDVLLLGTPSGAVHRLSLASSGTALEPVPLDPGATAEEPLGPITSIVRQEAADIFAVTTGRCGSGGRGGAGSAALHPWIARRVPRCALAAGCLVACRTGGALQ